MYMRKYGQRLRAQRKADGICIRCGLCPSRAGFTSCANCAEYKRGIQQRLGEKLYRDQKTQRDARVGLGLCSRCGIRPLATPRFCRPCLDREGARSVLRRQSDPDRIRRQSKESRERLREQILTRYGRSCACCGETTPVFLTIDHIKGGGQKHMREIGKRNLWGWLRAQGFPDGYQTLCWNCNAAKGILGACPHASDAQGIAPPGWAGTLAAS